MENHYVSLENRERMTVSQVLDVDAFDENTLWANVKDGSIEISGSGLNVERLDLQEGLLIVTGRICSFSYTDKKVKEKSRLFRLFRRKAG